MTIITTFENDAKSIIAAIEGGVITIADETKAIFLGMLTDDFTKIVAAAKETSLGTTIANDLSGGKNVADIIASSAAELLTLAAEGGGNVVTGLELEATNVATAVVSTIAGQGSAALTAIGNAIAKL